MVFVSVIRMGGPVFDVIAGCVWRPLNPLMCQAQVQEHTLHQAGERGSGEARRCAERVLGTSEVTSAGF